MIISIQKWARYNSGKRCELVYAKVQGRDQLIHYIKRSVTNTKETSFIHQETNIRTNIELPLNYLQVFLTFHPYASYRISGFKKFIVSIFNF